MESMELTELAPETRIERSLGSTMVTGATGGLGRHLAHALAAMQCEPVLVLRAKDQNCPTGLPEKAREVIRDVTDLAGMKRLLERERPATLFHLAGTRAIGAGEKTRELCEATNVHATVQLLIAARSAGVERIIIIGSADEYGNQVVEGPLNESLELHPVSPYAMSKAAATGVALAMHASNGLPVVILRPFTVYGPGQPRNMFIREAIDCAVRGEAFRMSEGCQKRDLVYIDDAIRAFLAAAQVADVAGKVINIGSGRAYALRDVAELIWRLSETRAPLMIGARQAGAGELHDTWADVTRARALLGWEARTSLEEGLRLTIEWATAEYSNTQAESRT